MPTFDRSITTLAEGQHGLFTQRQARLRGLSTDQIRRLLAAEACDEPAISVYRMAGSPRTWHQQVAIAVLAAAGRAAASHGTAAVLVRLPSFSGSEPETTRLLGGEHRPRFGRVHQTRVLPASHLVVVDGIVTTNTVRTVFDLAGRLHPDRTERLLDAVLARNEALLADFQSMLRVLQRRGRAGIAVMARLLADRGPGYVAPASQVEARALAILAEFGLPEPIRQFNAGDAEQWIGRVDLAYPDDRVLLEINTRRYHAAKVHLERDGERHARLAAAGWRVLPIWADLIEQRPWVFAELVAQALGTAPSRTVGHVPA